MSNLELLSGQECAERLGYSYSYFRDAISKRHGFPKKIGKKYNWFDVWQFMQKAA